MKSIVKIISAATVIMLIFTGLSVYAENLDFNFEGIESQQKKGDTIIIKKKDGTVIKRKGNIDTAYFKDGTIIEKDYKLGIIKIKKPNGNQIIENGPQGTKTYLRNGKKEVFSFKSKTPYGHDIPKITKVIQSEPVPVFIEYEPEKSDDILDGDIEIFFNELFTLLRKRVISKKYDGNSKLNVVFSHCRFGKYAYCYNKHHELKISFIDNSGVIKEFTINSLKLKNEKFRKNTSLEIYTYFKDLE